MTAPERRHRIRSDPAASPTGPERIDVWRAGRSLMQHPALEGALNINELREEPDRDGLSRRILRRYPKRNTSILESLAYEYHGIGFTASGGSLRRRTQDEQVQFIRRCTEAGLRVLPPLSVGPRFIENLFLDHAEKLDDYLTHVTGDQAARVTFDIFTDLFRAHRARIVYGDRWAENILIVPKLGFFHIDFDIEISGPFAREFEASQIAAYILGGAKAKVIPLLARFLTSPIADLSLPHVAAFLRGHAKYYDADHKYGSIDNEIETLIALMRQLRDS